MSTRKKRTLSGVVVSNSTSLEDNNKIILPAASMSMRMEKNGAQSEAVRGTEFLVDPECCRPWKFHNRDNVWMTVDKCQDLISSIRKNGQKVPIFARKLENDSEGKAWEIIAGRRRWFSCNYLGKKIRVKAIDASDRECAILMSLENKDRNDISEFEDAISYKQQLEAKLFDNQDEMAAALELKKSKLSKMLSSAKIMNYKEIMDLFYDITLLKINPIYALVLLLEKNKINEEVIVKKALYLKKNMANRKSPMKINVIINELMNSVGMAKKNNSIVSKDYKIGDHILLKASQTSSRKFVFEFNKSISSNSDIEELKRITMEAIKDFM